MILNSVSGIAGEDHAVILPEVLTHEMSTFWGSLRIEFLANSAHNLIHDIGIEKERNSEENYCVGERKIFRLETLVYHQNMCASSLQSRL